MGINNKIIANIFKGYALNNLQNGDLLLITRQKIIPHKVIKIILIGHSLQLLKADHIFYPTM